MSQYGPGDRPPTVKVRKKKPTVVKAPAGDVASSGGSYGIPEAKRAAKTAPIKKAVRQTYVEQPTARKRQILENATGEPGSVVRGEHHARLARNRELEAAQAQHDVLTNEDVAAIADFAARNVPKEHHEGFFAHILHKVYGTPGGDDGDGSREAVSRGMGAASITGVGGSLPAKVVKNVGFTVGEDPKHQLPKLGRDVGESVVSIPAGLVRSGLHPVEAAKAIGHDYARRYGPLVSGDPEGEKRFRERLKKEGVAPELFDVAAAATTGGATVGRGAQVAAEAGALGKTAERIATARPGLRISGDTVLDQPVSRNFGRNVAGAATDVVRKGVQTRRAQREEASAVVREAEAHGDVTPVRNRKLKKLQRVDVAKRQGVAVQAMKAEQQRETGAANRNFRSLNKHEKAAFKYAQQYGITDPDVAVATLRAHRDRIVAAREAGEGAHGRHDELPAIEALIQNAHQAFTPKLAEVMREERGRAERAAAGDPGVAPEQAQIRRYAPQAGVLGVERVKAESDAALAARVAHEKALFPEEGETQGAFTARMLKAAVEHHYERGAGESNASYLRKVKRAAKEAGLERPGYFPSEKRDQGVFASFALGGGGRAARGPKRYKGDLTVTGRESNTPDVLVRGIATNIKRKHSWNNVADTYDRHAFDWSKGKTPAQIRDELDRRGIDPGSVALWNPGAYRAAHQAHAQVEGRDVEAGDVSGETAAVSEALQHAAPDVDLHRLDTQPDAFLHSKGWSVVPKAIHDEIAADTRPSGAAGRIYDITKGKASRILLATPGWLQFQIGANALLTGLAGTGPVDAVKAQLWWKKLSDAERTAIEPYIGVHRFYDDQTRLGAATNNRIVNAYRAFKNTGLYQAAHKANPFDAIFRGDNAQNTFFRRAVFYSQAKRAAYREMGQSAGQMMRLQKQLTGVLTLGPSERMRALLRNQKAIDEYAKHVNDFLGDYTTYTHAERKILGRAVMFYGFLRFSLKFAFFVMPISHPIMSAILTQVGRLERDELEDIFGADVPPWEIGNYFSKDGHTRVALTRLSPFFNAIQWQGPQSVVGAFSPLAQITVNQVAGKNVSFDQLYTVDGSTAYKIKAADIGATNRAQIMLEELLSSSPYYRAAEKTGIPGLIGPLRGKQTDDASLFKPAPVEYKRSGKRAEQRKEIARQEKRGPLPPLKEQFVPIAGTPGTEVIEKARNRGKKKPTVTKAKRIKRIPGPSGGGTLKGTF